VLADRLLADVQLRGVAKLLLALEDGDQIALLRRRTERDVPRPVVMERFGIRLPDLDAGGHQLRHRGLEVVVAHDPARDPRRARGDARLVDDEDALAIARRVPGGREPVHSGADHE